MVNDLSVNARDTRDAALIPGSGRFPGIGNGNPFQYSYLGNPINRGAWWAIVHGMAELDTNEQHMCAHTQCIYVDSDLLIYPSPPFPLVTKNFFFYICDSIFIL